MNDTLCPHGGQLLPPESPWPVGSWTPYCRRCWREAVRVSLPVASCPFVGEPAGPLGWHLCDHPDEPLGAVVCACKGCGPACPGYPA